MNIASLYGSVAGEEVVVDLILVLRERGYAYGAIAETLNREGISARGGGRWYPANVRRVVLRVRPELAPARETPAPL